MEGILKRFDYRRGFGFIEVIGRPDAEEVFIHASGIIGGPAGVPIGARMRFDLVEARGGKVQAAHARVVRAGELGPVALPSRGGDGSGRAA